MSRAARAIVPSGTVGLVRVLLLFESSLYAAVTPILPHYARTLHLAKPAVGVLAAAYTLGLLPGSVLGGWVATRLGVRRTTTVGLVAFALGVAGFGFASSLLTLDLLRAIQGVACGLIWGGALTWVIAVTPVARRGATLGSVIGAATLGTLIGPLLGTIAVATSTGLVFSAVGAVSLGLAAWVHPQPDPTPPAQAARAPRPRPARRLRERLPSLCSPGALGLYLGTWMILLEAMTFGATNALLPLRLARFGGSAAAIGAAFVGAAALSTALSPLIGRVTDRHGPRLPITVGLVLSAVLVPALALPHSPALLAILAVLALGGPMTGYMIPAVSTMTDSAERHGIALVVASSLFNLAYAAGETIGAPAAAVISQASTDAVPLAGLGGLMLLTLIPARGLRKPPARSAGDAPARESEPSGAGAQPLAAPG
ncbi:MAG TPA: MFS transporter [Solirubrobacteraceae bacterium]